MPHFDLLIMLFAQNLRKTCLSALNTFDLFGIPIQLHVKHKALYHTLPSSLISLAILVFILYSFTILLVDLFERKDPNVINKVHFNENPNAFPITPEQFLFAVAVADKEARPIPPDPKYLTYTVQSLFCTRFQNQLGEVVSNCTTINYKPCSELNLTSIAQEMGFSDFLRNHTWCIDPEEWRRFDTSLAGTPNSPLFNSFHIEVLRCNETLFSGCNQFLCAVVCAPKDIQDQVLDRAYVGVFLPDRLLDQQLIGNPFKTVTKRISTSITGSQFKNMHVNFRKATVKTTENFYYYFSSDETYSTLQFEQQNEYIEYSAREILFQMAIYLEDKEIIYYRTYGNILEVLGSIGGLLELLTFLIGLIIRPLNQIVQELYLANSAFQFRDQADQFRQTSILPEIQGESKLTRLLRTLKQKKKSGYFGLFNYMTECGQQKDLVNQTIDQIYRKLDILFLLNKIIEIDKLKRLLLTAEQENLFNCITRPRIMYIKALTRLPSKHLLRKSGMKASKQMNLYDEKVFTQEEMLQNAFESYKLMKELPLSQINKNLIALLDPDLKEMFDDQLLLEIDPIALESSMVQPPQNLKDRKDMLQELEEILGKR